MNFKVNFLNKMVVKMSIYSVLTISYHSEHFPHKQYVNAES
jgi:hypothetical protein